MENIILGILISFLMSWIELILKGLLISFLELNLLISLILLKSYFKDPDLMLDLSLFLCSKISWTILKINNSTNFKIWNLLLETISIKLRKSVKKSWFKIAIAKTKKMNYWWVRLQTCKIIINTKSNIIMNKKNN